MLVVGQALVGAVGPWNPGDLLPGAPHAHVSSLGVRVSWAGAAGSAALLKGESSRVAGLANSGVLVERVRAGGARLAGTVGEPLGSGGASVTATLPGEHGSHHIDDLLHRDGHLLLHPPRARHGEQPVVLVKGGGEVPEHHWRVPHELELEHVRPRRGEEHVGKASAVGSHDHLGPLEEIHELGHVVDVVVHHDLLVGEGGLELAQQLLLVGDLARRRVGAGAVHDEVPLGLWQRLARAELLPGGQQGLAGRGDPRRGGGEVEDVGGVDLEGVVLHDGLCGNSEHVQELLLVGLAPHQDLGALRQAGLLEQHELGQGLHDEVVVHVSVPLDGRGQRGVMLLPGGLEDPVGSDLGGHGVGGGALEEHVLLVVDVALDVPHEAVLALDVGLLDGRDVGDADLLKGVRGARVAGDVLHEGELLVEVLQELGIHRAWRLPVEGLLRLAEDLDPHVRRSLAREVRDDVEVLRGGLGHAAGAAQERKGDDDLVEARHGACGTLSSSLSIRCPRRRREARRLRTRFGLPRAPQRSCRYFLEKLEPRSLPALRPRSIWIHAEREIYSGIKVHRKYRSLNSELLSSKIKILNR